MKTSCVAAFVTIVAAVDPTRTVATSVRPVPVIVTESPAAATRYTALASTRTAGITCSAVADSASSPASARTRNTPLAAASGTTAVSRVVPVRAAIVAVAPLANTSEEARSRFVPFTVSVWPVTIVAGENELMVTGPAIVIICARGRATPAVSTTVSVPDIAPAGTSTASEVGVRVAIVSTSAFRRTSRTRSRAVPASVMRPGGSSVVGVSAVTAGTDMTVKSASDSSTRPAAFNSMRPVRAVAGTVTSRAASESARKVASTPPTRAEVTALSEAPLTFTTLPGAPAVGANPVIATPAGEGAVGVGLTSAAGVDGVLSPPPQAASNAAAAQAAKRVQRGGMRSESNKSKSKKPPGLKIERPRVGHSECCRAAARATIPSGFIRTLYQEGGERCARVSAATTRRRRRPIRPASRADWRPHCSGGRASSSSKRLAVPAAAARA